ncbi:protein of unknown function [Clostridium beijerinckii]|nr:protein of unknown function [Clostridium beijerinckii]
MQSDIFIYITPPYSLAFLLTNLPKFPYTSPQNRSQFNQFLYLHYDLSFSTVMNFSSALNINK